MVVVWVNNCARNSQCSSSLSEVQVEIDKVKNDVRKRRVWTLHPNECTCLQLLLDFTPHRGYLSTALEKGDTPILDMRINAEN